MILALDISKTNTGWAAGGYGQSISFGSRSFSGYGRNRAVIGYRFAEWLEKMVRMHKPDAIAIETALLHGGAPLLLIPLAYEAEKAAFRHKIRFQAYQPNSIKKFLTGNGRAEKADMVHAVKVRGYQVRNDDEADAIAILLMHESSTNGKNPAL